MALTDTELQRLQGKEQRYQLADGGGLYREVHPTGQKVWRMPYRLGGRGAKKERVTLGEYPLTRSPRRACDASSAGR